MSDYVKLDTSELEKLFGCLSGKELNDLEKKSISKGLNVIKAGVRQKVREKLGDAATHHNPKYNDTLMQGVRSSIRIMDDNTMLGKVHVMGNRKKGSGSFRLRFFELGTTRVRKDGSIFGINKPKKKDKDGSKSKNYQFFEAGSTPVQSKAVDAMKQEYEKRLNEIING